MRNLFFTAIIAVMILSCKSSQIDISSIEGEYRGYHPSYEIEMKDGTKEVIDGFNIKLTIKNNQVLTQKMDYEPKNKDFSAKLNNGLIEILLEAGEEGKEVNYTITENEKGMLIVAVDVFTETFVLKTYEKDMLDKVNDYAIVKLSADVNELTESEKQLLPILFEIADIMDSLFWVQKYGDKKALLNSIEEPNAKKFAEINYGPWDKFNNNKVFICGENAKPKGINYYPHDITNEEFEALSNPNKNSWYSVLRRNDAGELIVVPYSIEYKDGLTRAASLLNKAADLSDNPQFKKYLKERAKAFLSDKYFDSDMAWMDMKTGNIDFIAGPIESYEDAFKGIKTAFEAFILLKDNEWSKKLDRFAELLPVMQKNLPVEDKYKTEVPGKDSDLGVYYAIYYAGDCNAGSKTIAINLPNDKLVNEKKGTRKLQLKNSMKAKFDKILVPISEMVINESQKKHITFDAFFENTMFHEIAHGLGISRTVNGKGLATDALMELYTTIEESKADIIGLYLITKLNEMGEFDKKDLMDNYVTYIAGIFRSSRFGASSAHGKANMINFNFFMEKEAFTKNAEDGTYFVNFENMKKAIEELGNIILVIQGDGDYAAAKKLIDEKSAMSPVLKGDLDRINRTSIPKDIIFEQGLHLINL